MDLLLTAGLPWPTILYTILLDWVMVITGLVGALVASSYKWGYFVFATVALFGIAYNVVWVGRSHARAIGPEVSRAFIICGVWTIFLWFIYPIAWGLSEGGNVIAPDSEAVFYGVLDILAKPVFGALLLWGHRNIDPATLGLHIRDYDQPPPHSVNARTGEKAPRGSANNGNNNGVVEPALGNEGVQGVTGTHGDTQVGQTTV
jgi:bacteriorhodopsin